MSGKLPYIGCLAEDDDEVPKNTITYFSISATHIAAMSTLADELLNDFGDSGSEGESEQQNGFMQDGSPPPPIHGGAHAQNGSMVLDGDEEDVDEDEEMVAAGNSRDAIADAEDEEEAKAKVEKMQLGGVSDVRNVASLMKTLEPVLEVRSALPYLSPLLKCSWGLHLA